MGYLNLVDAFVYKDPVFRAKLDALAENDAYLKANGWQTSTKIFFFQAAVPSGWTKDTTNNDKFLRVVSSSGTGTGGTKAPSATIALAHSAHSITAAPDHTHDLSSHTHTLDSGSDATNAAGNSGTAEIYDVGGMMYWGNTAGSGTSGKAVHNSVVATTFLTGSSAGTHTHGGNSSGSALTDITFAYCDVIVGGKDTSSGYTDLTTYFGTGDKIDFDPFVTLATNDEFVRLRIMPTGSVVVFGQAAAPTGWTKVATTNDKMLRVVSGTGGGTGGSQSPSASISMTHSHTTPTDSGHTHTFGAHTHQFAEDVNAGFFTDHGAASSYMQSDGTFLRNSALSGPTAGVTAYKTQTTNGGAGTTGSNINHTHSLANSGTSFQLAYVDVVQCSKDSTGAPQVYADCTTGVFAWKKLVSKQKLNKLAKNDEYLLFHIPEPATKSFFYMATVPINWTKIVTQDDKGLRIVSGSSGGTAGGGAQAMGTALPLAHTHTINTVSHTHAIGSHTHAVDSTSQTANPYTQLGGNFGVWNTGTHLALGSSGSGTIFKTATLGGSGNSDSVSHNHGGVSGSALTDVTLAYVDVLYASKD